MNNRHFVDESAVKCSSASEHESVKKKEETEAGAKWLIIAVIPCLIAALVILHSFASKAPDPYQVMDTDDAMRMAQVLDWHDGAGWFDMTQKRLDPPYGVQMHWSRFVDLPLLATFTILQPFYGREKAVQLTALWVPPLLGIVFYAVFVWASAPVVGSKHLPIAGIVCLMLVCTLVQFKPYRVDHHGWQIILGLYAMGVVLRVASLRRDSLGVVFAGLAGALGLWIGDEAIPPIALFCTVLTFLWIGGNDRAPSALFGYGLSLSLGVLLVYGMALPYSQWAVVQYDSFSLFSLALSIAVLVFSLLLLSSSYLVSARSVVRLLLSFAFFAIVISSLLLFFSDVLKGPYAGVSSDVSDFISGVTETKSLLRFFADSMDQFIIFETINIVAFLVIAFYFFVDNRNNRPLWVSVFVFTFGGVLLQCWQIRTSAMANAFAGVALSGWASRWMDRGEQFRNILVRVFFFALPMLSVLFVEISSVLLLQTIKGKQDTDVIMPTLNHILPVLKDKQGLGARPLLIASHINVGPRILLETPHQVLAAPYHRNDDGLKTIRKIFGTDYTLSHQTIVDRHVDLLYVYGKGDNFDYVTHDNPNALWTQLQQGKTPPWLKEIPIPEADTGEHLYQVTF